MTREYHYEIEWDKGSIDDEVYEFETVTKTFYKEFATEFEAVVYAIKWMKENDIDSFNLMYCRVEEVFDSEMRTNVLLWIGE